jgi:peptidoglycan/xylan/chitin deacetylase (PgdA/CDA1 family)
MTAARIASVSLDLDNKWSYLKTRGDRAWESSPAYLEAVVPRILNFLDERKLKITFFIVGQDAARAQNSDALREISARGHHVGNHSFNHEPWLHLYTRSQLTDELQKAEEAIEQATGVRTKGFRGPGFSVSSTVLRVLSERGYEYDASVFPNLLNPLARAYFLATTNLSGEEREQRKALFGSITDARRPVKPFWWRLDGARLLEVPVTTMPLLKLPIHMTYIHYLAKYSKLAASLYFRFALSMCRLTGTEPSLLLHPSDFMGSEDDPDLKFFPAMDVAVEKKLALLHETLAAIERDHELLSLEEYVRRLAARRGLRELEPVGI